MASPVAVHHFASFAEISSSIDSTRCIHPILTNGHRPCRISIDPNDASRIPSMLNAIRNAAGTRSLADIVGEFALLKCCRKVHQKRLRSSDLLNNLVQRWLDELDVSDQCEEKGGQVIEKQVVLHRYPTRSQMQHQASGALVISATRSHDANTGTSSSTHLAAEFAPYVRSPRYNVKAKVEEPLTKLAWKTGTVYMFTRPSSPGFVKIGYTTVSLPKRMRWWEESCLYTPLVQHAIHDVPHVFRVEQLIHAELKEYWRREMRCRHNPDCPKQHQEWFEIAVEHAKPIMNKWAEWMKQVTPYNDSGLLRIEWSKVCRRADQEGKPLTGQTLLNAMPPPRDENSTLEQSTPQALSSVSSTPSLHTKDLARLSRLLEELSHKVQVLSCQKQLRTPNNTRLSSVHAPAPAPSTTAQAVPTVA